MSISLAHGPDSLGAVDWLTLYRPTREQSHRCLQSSSMILATKDVTHLDAVHHVAVYVRRLPPPCWVVLPPCPLLGLILEPHTRYSPLFRIQTFCPTDNFSIYLVEWQSGAISSMRLPCCPTKVSGHPDAEVHNHPDSLPCFQEERN